MLKLTELQRLALKTMMEFDCPIYLSLDFYEQSFGHCWYGEHGLFAYPARKVARATVLALLSMRLIVEKRRSDDPPNWTTVFSLTPEGRKIVKGLQGAETV